MSARSVKWQYAVLLLLAALLFVSEEAEAISPEWTYQTGDQWSDGVAVDISGDGDYIAAGSNDGKVYLFKSNSNSPVWTYDVDDDVKTIAISADGEYIVFGTNDDDGKVHLLGKTSSTPLWSYSVGDDVRSVAISPDGEYIAAGTEDVLLFDKDSSTPFRTYDFDGGVYSSAVYGLSISADGKYVAAGSLNDYVYLLDKDSSTPLWSYETGGNVDSVDISADGEYLVIEGVDRAFRLDRIGLTTTAEDRQEK